MRWPAGPDGAYLSCKIVFKPIPKSIDRGIQSLSTPERHVETTLGPKITPQMTWTPNHVELEGVATGYRRVYLNVAFSSRKTVFSTEQRHERRSHYSPHRVNETAPLVSHRHEAHRTRFGPYLVFTLGPCGGINSFRRGCLVASDGRMDPDGHRNAKMSCPQILGCLLYTSPSPRDS